MALLYAIAGNLDEFERYLRLEIPVVQYRVKELSLPENYIPPVTSSLIVINDSIEEAKRHSAWGVHLGQQDLTRYDQRDVLQSGISLGISTHNDAEIDNALKFNPDYLAYGPIYETTTKVMPFAPCGVKQLETVVSTVPRPIVAIGGLTPDNADNVADTGVWAIAALSILRRLSDQMIHDWVDRLSQFHFSSTTNANIAMIPPIMKKARAPSSIKP